MTDNNSNDGESIDKEEFDERLEEIENSDPDPEDLPDLLEFSDLLDMREDLNEVNQGLDQTAGYWAEVTLLLEGQVNAAEQLGNNEKRAAIEDTLEKSREVAERIDGGETLAEVREQVEAQNE